MIQVAIMTNQLSLNNLKTMYNMDMIKSEILFAVNSNDIITDIEPSSTYILGLSPSKLIGKKFSSFLIEGCEDFSFFNFMLPRDSIILTFRLANSFIHVEVNYQQIYDSNNTVIGAYGSIIDISKHIKYKQRLVMIDNLLDNSKDIIYHYETFPVPRFVYISNSIELVLGHSADEDYNDPTLIFKITHPDDLEVLEKKASGNLDYSKPVLTRWKHVNGNYIWMEDYAIPIYDYNGVFIGVQGICRDVTEKIIMKEKLKHLSESQVSI
jgi:PAS domain S-box-containing protein